MLKAIGILVIIIAAIGWAYGKSMEQALQVHELKQFNKGLSLLKSGIDYDAVCIPVLMEQIGNHTEGETACFFLIMHRTLSEYQKKSFWEIWEQQSAKLCEKLKMPGILNDTVKQLGGYIGSNDRSMQIVQIQKVIDELEEYQQEITRKYRNDRKVNYALATAIGAMTVIVLF